MSYLFFSLHPLKQLPPMESINLISEIHYLIENYKDIVFTQINLSLKMNNFHDNLGKKKNNIDQ